MLLNVMCYFFLRHGVDTFTFIKRDSIYAIARPSVRLSVTRVYHRKTVEVRIMKLPPYGSPIPLVFAFVG